MKKSMILSFAWFLISSSTLFGQDEDIPSGSIYEKPYIEEAGTGAAVGGYIDLEFEMKDGMSTFDQHRLIPFIYSKINDRIFFATEIEFEHGGNPDNEGEIKIEYAALDISLSEKFSFRSGLILSPLGRFNLYHDSPLNDLTSRPLVARQIIPTTLTEAGMGFHGEFYPTEETLVNYEFYIVNGFNSSIIQNATSSSVDIRLRDGRGSLSSDNNENKALIGRILYSPVLGLETAVSFHRGKYDDTDEKALNIHALDVNWQKGSFELLAELATTNIELPDTISAFEDRSQVAYYVQGNYHFLQDYFSGWPGSTFTLIARYDWLDYNRDVTGDGSQRLTFGLNFRPIEDTVFKFDIQNDWSIGAGSSDKGESVRTIFFSMASYF